MSAQNESAVEAVRGLAVIKRWCGHEVFHRTKLKVPAIVAAYNMFMNAVDRMDQIRSTAPTRHREKHLPMTLFTLILDLAVNNARAIQNKLELGDDISNGIECKMVSYKRRLCEQLVTPYLRSREKPRAALVSPALLLFIAGML